MKRIIVTGTRTWDRVDTIKDLLIEHGTDDPVLVIRGGNDGADRLALQVAEGLGWKVESHRADMTLMPITEEQRDDLIVAWGGDVCLAFVESGNDDGKYIASRAEGAGIPVYWVWLS